MSPDDPRARPAQRAWPHLRAAFFLFHVVAVTLLALPAPSGGMDRRTWSDPTVKAEFDAWRGRLAAIGVELDARSFEDQLFASASAFMDLRAQVLAPFKPYHLYFGTWQSWRMFIAPHTHPTRLEIAVREGEAWRTVFFERSAEATWMRDVLDNDRMRSALFRYAWKNYASTWKEFGGWVAQRAAEDFPDADAVRLRYYRTTTRSAAEVRAGEAEVGEWLPPLVLKLEGRR
jgi:hypothetical protein